MVQRGYGSGLLLEAPQAVLIVRQGTRQDFYRDVTLQPSVARAINFAHPARANQRLNFVGTQFCSGR